MTPPPVAPTLEQQPAFIWIGDVENLKHGSRNAVADRVAVSAFLTKVR